MRYLLVGNGPSVNVEVKAKHADSIIQINHCEHRDKIAPEKMSYVVLVNTADPRSVAKVLEIAKKLDLPAHTRILLSRNLLFYTLKGLAAWLKNAQVSPAFTPFPST